MIGSGLFFPLTSTDGTEQSRLSAVLARMEQVPKVLDEARHNLKEADPYFSIQPLAENAGNTAVIEQIGSMIPAGSPLRSALRRGIQGGARGARQLAAWLKGDLAHRPHTG